MAISEAKTTKAGKTYYEFTISRGYGLTPFRKRWYPSETWAASTVKRELRRAYAEFERACLAGEILTREQKKEQEAIEAAEKAKLKTLREYTEQVFLPSKEVSSSIKTMRQYRTFLNKHIYPAFGNVLLQEISPAMIRALLLSFQAQYSFASVIVLNSILCGVFKSAYKDYTIPTNPMDRVDRPTRRKGEFQSGDEKALSQEELAHVLHCADGERLDRRAMIYLLADTGMRRGELCALRWSDVNFSEQTIFIRANVQYDSSVGVYETTPKNGRNRTIDVGQKALSLLRQLKAEQSKSKVVSQFVFPEKTGQPRNPDKVTSYIKRFGIKFEIAGLHPHTLRHTCATLALRAGVDVTSVSRRLGHASTSTTLQTYAHTDEQGIRQAGEAVRAAMGGLL